jgi:peptidoglycan/xylan/chitin deacetylase (PgdA/CDA1 family)
MAGAAGAAVVAGLAVAHAGPGLTGLGPVRRAAFRRLAGEGNPRHVALTFDDGPDPAATPDVARLLGERGVRATFFLLGQMVAKAPGLAADLAAAGHEIGVHGWEHRYLTLRGPRATLDDIRRATDLIEAVTGTRPRLYRPPYGVLTGGALFAARRLHDSDCTSPPGSARAALGALPRLLDECARRELPVGPLGQHGWS